MSKSATLTILAAAAALGLAGGAQAQESAESFYKGRKIDLIIGFSVGGGYDAYGRLVARHMGEHIPGKPTIVPRNMTGAGSRVAANYIFNVAPKDGTVLGIADQSIPLEQALGDSGIKFDSRAFAWIGNVVADNNVVATWHTSPIKTVEDAKREESMIGATGYNTSAQYPTVLNQMIGTKFKVIMGYPGGNEINLAMERGEVAGRGSNAWASFKATRPEWVRDKKLNILAQVGLKRAPDLPDVPLLMDLATNDQDRAAMRLLSAPTAIGRPFFAPPGTPKERVATLRAAFDAMVKDKAFLDEAEKAGLDINPVPGEELQQIVAEIIDAPAEVKKRLAAVLALVEREKTK
ncbi:MAG TPA: tripartite tricarboxylate transporter substrate-binding protein [Beijerinckiaceae bacterium]|jgi:tripartite-type tricarboxylate transporter receptor subunit TctC